MGRRDSWDKHKKQLGDPLPQNIAEHVSSKDAPSATQSSPKPSSALISKRFRRRLIGAGSFVLGVCVIPVVIDQEYVRYNPYILPVLVLLAVFLYGGLFLTGDRHMKWFYYWDTRLKQTRICLLRKNGVFCSPRWGVHCSVVTLLIGTSAALFCGALSASIVHVSNLKNSSLPHFENRVTYSQMYQYATGMIIDGIRWEDDMREYTLTITNSSGVEAYSFRERLFLPFLIIRASVLSASDSEGIGVSLDDEGGRDKATTVHDHKITEVIDSNGNWAVVTAAKMPAWRHIMIKIIGRLSAQTAFSKDFWLLYGCDYYDGTVLTHYGRMVRPVSIDYDGAIEIGREFRKKGHALQIKLLGGASEHTYKAGEETYFPMINPSSEASDWKDDR